MILVPFALAVSIALAAPITPAAPIAPGAPAGPEQRLGVAAIEIDGALVDARRDEAEQRLTAALARGAIDVVDLAATTRVCTDAACRVRAGEQADATWVVAPRLTIAPGDRDYALSVAILDARDGSTAATLSEVCELCGFEDALRMIEAQAAGALDTIARLGRAQGAGLTLGGRPPGIRLRIDGVDVGVTPLRVRLTAGRHRVVASKPGFVAQTLELEAIDGVDTSIDVALQPVPPRRDSVASRRIAAGAVTLGLGLAVVVAGAVLLAIDGDPIRRDCQADPDGDCRFVHGTATLGIVGVSLGGAASVAGAVVLGAGLHRRRRHAARTVAALGPGGLHLRF